MASDQERAELDTRARQGETVVTGGTGGKRLGAQEHLAEGGETRKQQLGAEWQQEMGRKGGLSTSDKSGGSVLQKKGLKLTDSKYKTRS